MLLYILFHSIFYHIQVFNKDSDLQMLMKLLYFIYHILKAQN